MVSESNSKSLTSVAIRRCNRVAEFRECVEVQRTVWDFDPIDIVSHHILSVAYEIGGHVFGAFDCDRMIGFAFAFPATRHGTLHLHSHMAAVLPEYRDRGIGRLLKLAQRSDAIARGIHLIEWTFDPLETRNAYFNIARLGAIVRRYIPDFYGTSTSPLHANLPTDRLVAEWHLNSARVIALVAGERVNQPAGLPLISVPKNVSSLRQTHPARAAEVQARIRKDFSERIAQGYEVTGFSLTVTEGNYLLEKPDSRT